MLVMLDPSLSLSSSSPCTEEAAEEEVTEDIDVVRLRVETDLEPSPDNDLVDIVEEVAVLILRVRERERKNATVESVREPAYGAVAAPPELELLDPCWSRRFS